MCVISAPVEAAQIAKIVFSQLFFPNTSTIPLTLPTSAIVQYNPGGPAHNYRFHL